MRNADFTMRIRECIVTFNVYYKFIILIQLKKSYKRKY